MTGPETDSELVETDPVRESFESALGLSGVGSDDDFFALGGHSLLALEVVDQIETLTGVAIPLRVFFANATIDSLRAYVANGDDQSDHDGF